MWYVWNTLYNTPHISREEKNIIYNVLYYNVMYYIYIYIYIECNLIYPADNSKQKEGDSTCKLNLRRSRCIKLHFQGMGLYKLKNS